LTRRILILNLLLAALTALAGWRLRVEWLAAKARENAVLDQPVRAAPPPAAAHAETAAPLAAAAYSDIAQKMLFSRDRNPVVLVEAAPAPPPPPMPALPVVRGVMNVGGPIAIMSESAGAPVREYRPGQAVGEFKLVDVAGGEIVLEWRGQRVARRVEELRLREESAPQEAAVRTEGPAPTALKPMTPTGPGVDMGAGRRSCQPNDSSPPGTVADGLIKVVTQSTFGPICRWEPAR
jgi:hypothetical protein